MRSLETPEQRWGSSPKQYHRTGEVSAGSVIDRLAPDDAANLQAFSQLFLTTARQRNVQPHLILAGSAADLNSKYQDIDLLVHVEPVKKVPEFAVFVESSLEASKDLNVLVSHSHGSLILMRKLVTTHQVSLKFMDANYLQKGVAFDVTFANAKDGTYRDVLAFHQANNLAFCELPI